MILILGYSKSGKTLAGDLLATRSDGPAKSVSTSDILIDKLAEELDIPAAEIIKNKDQYRQQLWELGRKLQKHDPLCLVREAYYKAFNGRAGIGVVTGVRNQDELEEIRKTTWFNKIIWINRYGSNPNGTDCLRPQDADMVIENNGTIEELQHKLRAAVRL